MEISQTQTPPTDKRVTAPPRLTLVHVGCLGLLLAGLLFQACVTRAPIDTASGKPEVSLAPATTKAQARDLIVQVFLNNGFQLRRTDEYSLIFGKPSTSLAANLMYGSRYETTPEERVSVNLIDTGNGTRIIFTLQYVTNPGSAFERLSDASTGAYARRIRDTLDQELSTFTARRAAAE
jgi:hypothetical protein